MTLIQTLVTDEVVIQVSDRRLTWPDGTVATDEYCKLVYWNGWFTVGFTGIARIDPQATESVSEWIAKTVADYNVLGEGIEAVAKDAANRINKLPWKDKRLTIIFAGFAMIDAKLRPLVFIVTNMEPDGSSKDQNVFEIYNSTPPTLPWSTAVGARITPWHQRMLNQRIPRMLKQPNGVERALKLMVALQRYVAADQMRRDSTKVTVGEDALCVVIPRNQVAPGTILTKVDGYELPEKSAAFEFFPKGGFEFRKHGPLMASGGFVNVDLTTEADPANPDHQTVSMQVLKTPWDT